MISEPTVFDQLETKNLGVPYKTMCGFEKNDVSVQLENKLTCEREHWNVTHMWSHLEELESGWLTYKLDGSSPLITNWF